MSISFSGLASGLDTSSWVESLVALKKAKVTTLEEEKKEVQSLQETLSQIKSFFSSFRSMLEKVTDAKFGVASMDLFAQNIATSSNLEALTASATTEAEEATYNVLVDKLASETKANSNYSYMTTIVQTTTATGDSKLINLGVKAGNIGVKVNGVEHGISITENDTLSTFIEKLKNIGVNASYNEDSGIFSIDVGKDDINDIGKTGIKDALHLNGVNEGYQSDSLTTSKTDTIFSAATRETKLSELGVKNGSVTVSANGANYTISINNTTKLGDFIDELRGHNIEATLDKDGIFTISDAEITNEGSTDIKNALGLDSSIYGKSQITGNLKHETTITQTTLATSATFLKDLEGGKDIKNGNTIVVKNSNNESKTITITNASEATLGGLISDLENAGLYAAIKNDGTVEITGGTITGGTLDVEKLLGLQKEPYTAIVTGKPLTETVETHKIVDLQTRLVDDLKVKEGYLEVTDADGNKFYEKIYSGQTIADFMTDMGNLGINTKLDETTGILTITGGAFKTLSDADVQALVANATIVEPDSRYHHGTNLLACLYGADTISTDQITVASTYSKTKALRHTVTNTINATKNTTLEKLGLSANGTVIFDVRGESRTINITKTMTISDLMNQLKDAGIGSSFDEDTSRLTIENATITGGTSGLANILDLTTTISGKYVTSDELYTSDTITIDATRDTLLKDYGISRTMSVADRTVTIYNSDGSVAATTVVGEGTTIGNLIDFINEQNGISANLKDGFLTIHNGYIENAALEAAMGLSTSNKNSYALGSIMTVTTTAAVTGETTIGSIFGTIGTLDLVKDGYNLKFNNKDISVSASTTLNELINAIYENGGTASLDHTGRLSVEGGTLTGSVAQALGITSYTHTSSVSATGEKLYVTDNVYANRDTTLKDLGVTGRTSYTIYNSLGQATTTINIENTATIGDFLDGLKANGIDGVIANGVIKLDSADGSYIQGELATTLGLATQTVTEVVSTTQMSTAQVKHTATLNADLKTTMGELGVAAPDNVFDIYDKNDNLLASFTITEDSTTIEDLFNNLKAYDIVGSINNGVISLYSPNGNYVSGTLADKLGIATEAGENRTMTVGTTVTSTIAVTYTQDVIATEDSLISDYIPFVIKGNSGTGFDIGGGILIPYYEGTIYDSKNNICGTVRVTSTSTFGELFRKLGEYGIDADIHDGVIEMTSLCGNYLGLQAGGTSETKNDLLLALDMHSNYVVTTQTVGASISSTDAITYTSTITATGTTRLYSVLGYEINGTITADGVTGTTIGISTAQDLVNLAALSKSNDFSGKTFVLRNNIDMSSVTDWQMIGATDSYFAGTFDGQGYTIRNLTMTVDTRGSREGVIMGLFASTDEKAIFRNLKLSGFNFTGYSDDPDNVAQYVGALIAAGNGLVNNVEVENFTANLQGYNITAGGIIGFAWGANTIINSSTSGTINANRGSLGGFVGWLGDYETTIKQVQSHMNMFLNDNDNGEIGGIIGLYDFTTHKLESTISDCYFDGIANAGVIGAVRNRISDAGHTLNINNCIANDKHSSFRSGIIYAVNDNKPLNDSTKININNSYVISNVRRFIKNYNEGIGTHFNFTNSYIETSGANKDKVAQTLNLLIWDTENLVMRDTVSQVSPYSFNVVDPTTGNSLLNATLSANSTIQDVINELQPYGTVSFNDGVLSFNGNNGTVLTGNLAEAFGITVQTNGTNYYNTSGRIMQITQTNTLSTTDTTFGELSIKFRIQEMLNRDVMIKINNDSGVYGTIFVTSSSTIDDLFTQLAAYDIQGSLDSRSGKISLNPVGDNYISDMNILILEALNMFDYDEEEEKVPPIFYTTLTTSTLASRTSKQFADQDTKTMKTSTTLGDLGASGTLSVSFTQDGQDVTLTFQTDDTVDDILTALAGYGISGQVVDGKLSLTGNKHTFITSISDNLKSALQLGDNITYSTVITEGTTVNTDSNKQTYEDANAKITGDTVLSSIEGFQNGNGSLIVHKTDGTFVTISVDASKTLDEFFEQISRYGIIGSVDSQGVITITGVGNAYLQQDANGSNILTALKLSNVAVNVKTVTVNRTSDTLSHIATVAAKSTTTLENLQDKTGQSINFDSLGKAGLILHAYSDAGNTFATIEFSKTDTIYDIIDKLAEYGIDARLDADGRFSVTSSTLTDFDLSGEIGTFLMGAYTKNYGEDTTHNVSTLLVDRTITQMTDASKLADFGIAGGDIRVIQDGKSYTVNVDMTKIKTIGDFRGLLAQYGFNSYIDDAGRLNVIGIGDSTLEQIDGGSNILDRLGLLDWTKGEITQTSTYLTDTSEVIRKISMSDKLKDLTNSAGVNLGITAGQIYVYQDGTRSALNIDVNDTLETLAAKLSQYGISVGISQEGKLYFDGNNNSYLTTSGLATANASNILQKFNISNNWSTRYDSTSKNLSYTEDENTKVNGSTKLKDLKDTNGNNLGITTGSFYVYNSGVRNTETITDDTTIDDLKATLAKYGLIADFDENGVMSVGAYNNTYLATSALAGNNSNIVNALFEQWNFVNIYTSNNLDIPKNEDRAITRDTKLADINEGTYQAGFITVVKDGVKTNISLTADDTVGTLMDELALYGFESVINDKGQLMIKNTGDSLLQKYTGTSTASNALELLGIDLNNWINTNSYDSKTLDVTQTTTSEVAATRDTLLSKLGVSTGEYYIYNNGVKYTAMISSDETLGSFMDTLKSFGIETSLVQGNDGSVLTIVGKGDSYVKKSTSTTNASNVVETLFKDGTSETTLEYKGLEQTSTTTVITDAITEDTLVSYFDKPWGKDTLKSAGTLAVVVNGQTNTINIVADETFGSLLEKFRALGLEATLSKDGQIMIQSGYDTMTIKSDGTSSNLLTNINLNYKKDLGGYSASSVTVNSTTTSIEEKTLSVANYAKGSTKMSMLNIADGSLTVYDDGRKATIEIKADETFNQLRTRLSTAFADLDLTFENGYLKIFSKNGKNVEVGSTTDKGNFGAITGIASDGNGAAVSSRELYCVNGDTAITTSGIFRRGNVTEGTFTIGNAVFNIDSTTTLSNLISQINSSEAANATAFWDNVDGKFVIKSRTTGAALVNIEAGTSNFTDILGFTNSEWNTNGSVKTTKMNINTQEVGDNAKVKINGTTYTSTSNNIGSDVTRIKGLTINLKGLTKDSAVTLKVERDKETLANAVSGVVDSYNELMKNVDEAIASDGDLKNESTLKLIRNQLRNLMTSSDSGTTVFRNLDSIGIGVAAASGSNIATTNSAIVSMTFDKDKFLKAYEADQDAVKDLIIGGANNKGIFTKVEDLVESTLKSVSGYFASTETNYSNKIKDLDKKITKANKEVDRYKARLEAKFQSMDMLIAQMQQQYSSFLTT